MISSVNGWLLLTTPVSMLGVLPQTSRAFTYFVTFQTLVLGALYKRKNVKPLLVFLGLGSLMLIAIYDMYSFRDIHNIFAITFFVVQPIILYLEYRKRKDYYSLTKVAVLSLLIVLTYIGIIPLPIFEYLSYALLIVFL
jgi:hypothetical protein|tara:strand:- start:166 stop:582 length:417 start_codon:yes stop_codon:yes gene_type:complete